MPLEIRPTGVPGLDRILGGGLPRGTLLMVAGPPGSGKTILAQQLCFGWLQTALAAQSLPRQDMRTFLYRLSAQLNLLGVTAVITIERSPDDAESDGEFTTADGIIGLSTHVTGEEARRLPFDLTEFDAMLSGGLPAGSATLVAGSVGTGKTLLALYFLGAGLRRGEPALFFGFQEDQAELLAKARVFQRGLSPYLDSDLFTLHTLHPVELDLDQFSSLVRREVERTGARRLVIDSVNELDRVAADYGRTADFVAALHAYLRQQGVTTLLLQEIPSRISTNIEVGDSPLAVLCENLLVLRYVTYRSALYRIAAVIKMRDAPHDHSIRQYTISEAGGLAMLARGESRAGLLAAITTELSGGPAVLDEPPSPAALRARRSRHGNG